MTMTITQILTDIGAAAGAIGTICTIVAHLPFMPAKYAEAFARWGVTSQKFSVNQRPEAP